MEKTTALQPSQRVNKYAGVLFSYTSVRISDSAAAEDIVQETFLSAWKARDTYQGQASQKNWLYAICKNKIIDYYRRQSSGIAKMVVGEENKYFDEAEHRAPETQPKEWGINYPQLIETKEFYTVPENVSKN